MVTAGQRISRPLVTMFVSRDLAETPEVGAKVCNIPPSHVARNLSRDGLSVFKTKLK